VKVGGSVVEAMVGVGDGALFCVSGGIIDRSLCCLCFCFER
jgi:hypothetical protein